MPVYSPPAAAAAAPKRTLKIHSNFDGAALGTGTRWSSAVMANPGGSGTVNNPEGLRLTSGATAGGAWKVVCGTPAGQNSNPLVGNIVLSAQVRYLAPTGSGEACVVAGEISASSAVPNYGANGTDGHFGFKFVTIAGVSTLYSTNGNGTTETATALAIGTNFLSDHALMAVKTGAGSILFYLNGTLVATHTTNIPNVFSGDTALMELVAHNRNTAEATSFWCAAIAYEKEIEA